MNRKFISNSNKVLREVLNSKDNIDILQNIIENLLKIKIKDIELNPYLEEKSKYLPEEENFGIADVRVKLLDGEEINIGIQFIDGYYIKTKMLLYYLQIHNNQLEYNKERVLAKTTTINLLDFNYFDSKDYHQKILIKTKENNENINDNIELHIFELPKFKISTKSITGHEAWMIYFAGERNMFFNKIVSKFEKINKLDNLLNQYWENEKMK